MAAVILGMRDKENLFFDATGTCQAKYVPAFVRRYPLVFSTSSDGNRQQSRSGIGSHVPVPLLSFSVKEINRRWKPINLRW